MEIFAPMDGILAIEISFCLIRFLYLSKLLVISFSSPITEVWFIITDSYMHWSMQRLEIYTLF
jgi:hypothetical protein